jgi:SAM-dependent methyltransferase
MAFCRSNKDFPLQESRYADGTYLENNPTWHEEDSVQKVAWIERFLRKAGLSLRTIAEVGCGAGGILAGLQRHYPDAEFFGYEISPQAFEIARGKANSSLHIAFQDLLELKHEPFDLLMAIDVFEHVPDYVDFIARLRSRAEYKLFHVPLDLSVRMLLQPRIFTEIRGSLGHLHYFNKTTAIDTLKYCGYEIIDCQYTYWSLDYPSLSLKSRLAKLPRRLFARMAPDLAMTMLGGGSVLILTR